MKLQQYLINYYLHIPFEDFSHKAVSALGLLISIENNPLSEMSDKQKKAIIEDIKKVREIIATTRPRVQVSMYVMDRNIIPQDIAKSSATFKITFNRVKAVEDKMSITLSADEIQKYLCEAMAEINEILMREIAGFSDQMFMDDDL